ncbi:MAG TPA: trigger factor [Deltaproteobacteria bacterium]|nr:trigger factor [Deltaproteobacteria bacterium]
MKVEITDVSSTRKEMKVIVPKEEVNSVTDDIYRDVSQKVTIKGFRKGKAPRNVVKMFYADYIQGELSKKLVNDKFEQAIRDNKLFVVSMPEINNDLPKEDEDFTFTAQFDIKPDIVLDKYTGFELNKMKVNVEDENINDVLHRLQETYATINEIDDPEYKVVQGDYAIVDVVCEETPELNRERMTVEARGRSALPGLDEAVMEMSVGKKKELDIEFPDDHFMEDMRGKSAHISFTVSSIKHRELPELDDEFAKKARQGVEGMDELKKIILEDLTERIEADSRTTLERQIQDKLIEANPFDVPESLVRLQAGMMIQGISQRLTAQGVKLDDLYPDAEAFQNETMESAEKLTRSALIIEAVAKKHEIISTDEDITKEIDKLAQRYNMPSDVVRKGMEEKGSIDEMKFGIVEKKVFDYIIENSEVKDVDKLEEESDDASADSSGADE